MVELELNAEALVFYGDSFQIIDSVEVLKTLDFDFKSLSELDLACITVKDGFSLGDLNAQEWMQILSLIDTNGKKNKCIIRINYVKEVMHILEEFDQRLIWDKPLIFSEKKLVLSVVGDQRILSRFFQSIKWMGKIRELSCMTATFQSHDLLSCLTEKQREIVIEAKRSGYFDYPRKTNLTELAQKLNLSKSTTSEHLQKAEGRLMTSILFGY